MPPSTSTETEYLPLRSSTFNDTPRPKPDVLTRISKKVPRKSSPTELRYIFLIRTGAFIAVEFGFIILASLAMTNPIPLHISSSITLTEAKGALTIISIIWHTLAVFTVKDIILHIFSAEWMEQYRKSGTIVLGETDGVSRITSGIIDQIQHFISRRATSPFRLGFVSALLLLLLNGLGPSAITINPIPLEYPLKIKVANLTVTNDLDVYGPNMLVADRANLITRLEQVENATYGFRAQQTNVLIPWPSSDLISRNETIKYPSDIITYNFDCSWKQPTANDSVSSWTIDDQEWSVFIPFSLDPDNPEIFTDAREITSPSSFLETYVTLVILPMLPDSNFWEDADSPLIAFLFVGSNTTLSNYVTLNLEDIPTNVIPPKNATSENADNSPALVTALLCDPQLNISPATVTLFGSSLQATNRSGPSVVKNIPKKAANAIFSQSLLQATSVRESYGDQSIINAIASILFLTDPSLSHDDDPKGIKPLSLDRINQQMNTVHLSSAKAFLSGYRPNQDNLTFPAFEMIDTDAVGERQELALVGSKPFLIALVAVSGVLTVLLATMVSVVRVDQLQTFDLENIIQTLRMH